MHSIKVDSCNLEVEKLHIIKSVWTNSCRFLLAVAFVFSGFVKAIDPLGSYYKIQDYLTAFGLIEWLPDYVIMMTAVLLAAIEFTIGIYLLIGIRRKIATTMALAIMLFMTPLTLYLAIANPVPDCGCFGDAWVLTNWETFAKNVLLLSAAIVVATHVNQIKRFVTEKLEWLVSTYTILFIIALSSYCSWYLPIIDFRPYKVGTDINVAMQLPPDADVNDMPEINDFWLADMETGEDRTYQVLNDENYTFLMIAPHLQNTDDSNIDLINELFEYAQNKGYKFYALTASNDEAVAYWSDRTGAEYSFLQAEDVTLKTMVRSNPGFMLLKKGIIVNKWSNEELPDEYVLVDDLDKLALGQQKNVDDKRTLAKVLLWFFVPQLILIVFDVVFVRRRNTQLLKRRSKKVAEISGE